MTACDYAGCAIDGAIPADGWWFCPKHAREHRLIVASDVITAASCPQIDRDTQCAGRRRVGTRRTVPAVTLQEIADRTDGLLPAEFRVMLIVEQFGVPTPEWHPDASHQQAAAHRVRLVEDALWLEQQATA